MKRSWRRRGGRRAGRAYLLVEVGKLYQKHSRDQQAADAWARAIALADEHPTDVDLVLYAAEAHLQLGQMKDAQAGYESAAALAPDHPLPHVGLGEVARQQGHLGHALSVLQQAVVVHPGSAAVHSALGRLYRLLNEPERALVELEAAVRADYGWAIPHRHPGGRRGGSD